MKTGKLISTLVSIFGTGLLVIFLTNPIACSSSSSSRVVEGGTQITVNNLGKNIDLSAGVTREIVVIKDQFDLDKFGGAITELQINLFDHLEALTLENPVAPRAVGSSEAGDAVGAKIAGSTMTIRVARYEESDIVCSTGELYGPFAIELNDDFSAGGVSPASASATRETLDIINTGGYSVCIKVTPVITAIASLDTIEVDIGNCEESPADIAGSWGGTYSCTSDLSNLCDEAGPVTLDIVQDSEDPSRASYTDGSGASYQGRVCGNRFSYQGGVASSYDESGTFILNSDGSASKSSSYRTTGATPVCRAECTDVLTRL